jgi:fido (protein-threonine AMPylation protein)
VNKKGAAKNSYFYPDTNTFINNYGIKQEDQLASVEREVTAARIMKLEMKEPQKDGYDFKNSAQRISIFLVHCMIGRVNQEMLT